jgi:hypothetical protein
MNHASASKPLIPFSAVTKIKRKGSSLLRNGSPAASSRAASSRASFNLRFSKRSHVGVSIQFKVASQEANNKALGLLV